MAKHSSNGNAIMYRMGKCCVEPPPSAPHNTPEIEIEAKLLEMPAEYWAKKEIQPNVRVYNGAMWQKLLEIGVGEEMRKKASSRPTQGKSVEMRKRRKKSVGMKGKTDIDSTADRQKRRKGTTTNKTYWG